MGIMVYSLLWVVQDFVHQPYVEAFVGFSGLRILEFVALEQGLLQA